MSMHETIVEAVKTSIETLTGEPTVALRDRFAVLEGDLAALPLVVLVKGQEFPATRYTFGGGAYRGYEVLAYVVYAQNHQVQTGIDDAAGWRDQIRKRLIPDSTSVPPILTGVSAVWDVNETQAPAVPKPGLEDGYEVASLGLRFETNEAQHA